MEFGVGTGPILFADLQCNGTEGNEPLMCPRAHDSTASLYCNHGNDVGVHCEEIKLTSIKIQ